MESKGCAFLMDMGTGKTITTIAVAGAMYQTGRVKKLLVVSPKSIVQVWQQEFDKFADFPYSVAVLDGHRPNAPKHCTGWESRVATT